MKRMIMATVAALMLPALLVAAGTRWHFCEPVAQAQAPADVPKIPEPPLMTPKVVAVTAPNPEPAVVVPAPVVSPTPKTHATGLVLPPIEVRRASHQTEARRHAVHYAKMAMKLAEPLPTAYDCRTATVAGGTLNISGPIKDQANCGSCYLHSYTETIESANILRKNLPPGSSLSVQYSMDGCGYSNGGCGGGDANEGFHYLKSHPGTGIPLESVYGAYKARTGTCHLSTTATGYTINDWGYCSQGTGEASVDQIKAAVLTYGEISVCIAADNAFIGFTGGGVFKDTGYRSINHQVIISGWDDSKQAWLLKNSWGDWADNGYCWIAWGANGVGTEAMWASAGTPVVLTPTGPTPPGPSPRPPTRRMAALLADLPLLIDKYNDGTQGEKSEVLSLLDDCEKRMTTTKQHLGLAP